MKKRIFAILSFALTISIVDLHAEDSIYIPTTLLHQLISRVERLESEADSSPKIVSQQPVSRMDAATEQSNQPHRLTLGGYGEATMKQCFYSNNYLRYTSPEKYQSDRYGEFDLPHVCLYIGYDFGHGWSFGSEIEFEHGGVETAVEIEEEEGGEYESEVERGGEVALEQFWLQKKFNRYAIVRAGMLIVPLGGTNAHHEPNQFFGVYRPEGDNTIIPCTWHEPGLQLSGRYRWLQYTAQVMPGLESDLFGSKSWINGGSASPYEFKLANTYAGLARFDFFPLSNRGMDDLRISISGYTGTSFRNNLTSTSGAKYEHVKGLVSLLSTDWSYSAHHLLFRGSVIYGHLGDAAAITAFNKQMSKNSVSKRQNVASDAYSAGAELGYEFFHFHPTLAHLGQQLYLWARYDIYDSQARTDGSRNYWAGRQKVSVGINYFPIREIVVKGELGYGILNQNPFSQTRYNNEPYVALSVNYCGFFEL